MSLWPACANRHTTADESRPIAGSRSPLAKIQADVDGALIVER